MEKNLIVRFARTIWGIWGIIVFFACLVISFISYGIIFTLTNKEKAPFIAHRLISRPWSKVIFFLYGIRLIVKNKDVLDINQTYVFIGNHRSQLDIPSYAIATNHTIRFLAKVELTKIPLLGFIIRRLYITVDRKDKVARARSMDNMMKSIKDGISVFICPEGTRNKTSDPLLPFHDGAFRLAIQAQVPLGILVLKNTDKLLSPVQPIELSPGKIYADWLQPIPTKGLTQDDLPALREKVIMLMTEELLRK
jgi:1-acyl-sn-glycerol-3-phosphate acyltransferase